MAEDRCIGHCCRKFYLPYTPAELVESYAYDIAATNYQMAKEAFDRRPKKKQTRKAKRRLAKKHPKVVTPDLQLKPDAFGHYGKMEIRQIADMVVYLGWLPEQPDLIPVAAIGRGPGKMSNFYTCRNLKPNGDCGIYDTRPRMCRDYPYGSPCRYTDCASTCARTTGKGSDDVDPRSGCLDCGVQVGQEGGDSTGLHSFSNRTSCQSLRPDPRPDDAHPAVPNTDATQ